MGRFTLRLPNSLHQQLEKLARREGVSLNQYVVYSLARQATLAYTVQPIPDDKVSEQKVAFNALLQSLGEASFSEIEQALADREEVEPEAGLRPEMIERLRNRVATAHSMSTTKSG